MGEYGSRLHKAMTSLFSQGGLWIPPAPFSKPHITLSSCTQGSSPVSLPPSCGAVPPQPHPSPSLGCCRVTAPRRCVRVSSAGAVWSECVVSRSAERLLTGWMRARAILFTLIYFGCRNCAQSFS